MERALLARWPESQLDPTLDRVQAVLEVLGRPQREFRAVHITGTNGKTSTARMVDELLRATGRVVGLFTSPHLESVRERIVIDGAPVTPERFVEAFHRVLPALEVVERQGGLPLSFFEVLTVMAIVVFAEERVDVAVVEVGMGGEWDATNVVDGEVAVITPVALDHTEYLGPDTVSIAGEKAGIIKSGAQAVLATQSPEVEEVLRQRAANVGAAVLMVRDNVELVARVPSEGGQALHLRSARRDYPDLALGLLGEHQAENATVALAAVEAFLGAGLSAETAREALAKVTSTGRLEQVWDQPPVVLDAAHNPHGMATTIDALQEAFAFDHLAVVLAVLSGKDATGMLHALAPVASLVVATQSDSPRCLPAPELAALAREILGQERVRLEPQLPAAIEQATLWAKEHLRRTTRSGVLITGSITAAGQARTLLQSRSAVCLHLSVREALVPSSRLAAWG